MEGTAGRIVIRKPLLIQMVGQILVLAAGLNQCTFFFKTRLKRLADLLVGTLSVVDDLCGRNALVGREGRTEVQLELVLMDEREGPVEVHLILVCASRAEQCRSAVVRVLSPVILMFKIRIVRILDCIFGIHDDQLGIEPPEQLIPAVVVYCILFAGFQFFDFIALCGKRLYGLGIHGLIAVLARLGVIAEGRCAHFQTAREIEVSEFFQLTELIGRQLVSLHLLCAGIIIKNLFTRHHCVNHDNDD